ncbi:MAG: helix-turn-helix transcriptional regulator [Candidatus Binatia bacterium]|nr:helix-turn-helix transcriptional regulator [Candidatus Binatia bacterium]
MPSSEQQDKGFSIAALRRRLNMTQEEFAHAIGVTVSTVNRWENGHITPSRLARRAMENLLNQLAQQTYPTSEKTNGNNASEGSHNVS